MPVPYKAEPPLAEQIATPEPLSQSSTSSVTTDDSWKAVYESQVETWRAQSSEAREKAEKERERWEAVRAAEKKEDERLRALELPYKCQYEPTENEHQTGWENVIQHPERTETPSPSHRHTSPATGPTGPTGCLSATVAIFDSTLSTRTRVKALFSSLAINLLLPFVNGVMLGFGEIFAKNVVLQWFGWKPVGTGHVAASTGIGSGIGPKTSWPERR